VGSNRWNGQFAEHVKGLVQFSPGYEQAFKTWREVYEAR
jgi:hypothetical protein